MEWTGKSESGRGDWCAAFIHIDQVEERVPRELDLHCHFRAQPSEEPGQRSIRLESLQRLAPRQDLLRAAWHSRLCHPGQDLLLAIPTEYRLSQGPRLQPGEGQEPAVQWQAGAKQKRHIRIRQQPLRMEPQLIDQPRQDYVPARRSRGDRSLFDTDP